MEVKKENNGKVILENSSFGKIMHSCLKPVGIMLMVPFLVNSARAKGDKDAILTALKQVGEYMTKEE